MHKFRRAIFKFFDPTHTDSGASRVFNFGMLVLIFFNILAVVLETEESFYSRYRVYFYYFELFSVGVFTVEYILRLWTCTEQQKYKSPVLGRLQYALSPSMLIDLFSFLPFYIPLGGMDLRFIRAVRLFRLFRLFKMGRYSQSLNKLANVLKSKKEELVITLFSSVVLLILASSLMYFIERESQPELFGSIPKAMWWGAVTLTTVGYGDVYPMTLLGRIIGAFIAVLGIGLFALPAGIIASGFASELQKQKLEQNICPHCGQDINTTP
ncbi:MAG: ion transporter [Chloroflexi bacterium]|nr:MAG: ion transporter [Chloroflexota bacterium]